MKLWQRLLAVPAALAGVGLNLAFVSPADASLEFCNQANKGKIYVALAYSVGEGNWQSEGWLNLEPGECAIALSGDLRNRYYYYFAETDGDYEWRGDYKFCVSSKKFDFTGADKSCEGANARWEEFHEMDTGNATDFTMNLK